jgi:hypothetical protein
VKKVDVLQQDVECLDGVVDEVKTMVKAQERDLKRLREDFAIHKLTTEQHRVPYPKIDIWEMYNAGPTGWRCARNHPGYFEFKVGAKIIFGCSTCGVSFELADHQIDRIRRGHNHYAFPVPPRL